MNGRNSRSRSILLALVAAVAAALVFVLTRDSTPPADPLAPPARTERAAGDPRDGVDLAESERAQVESSVAKETPPAPRTSAPARAEFEVHGRLLSADGSGAAGVECAIEHVHSESVGVEGARHGGESSPFARSKSGPDGSFVFALTPPPEERIRAFQFVCKPRGFTPIRRYTRVIADERVVELGDLLLTPSARVAGFVRDASNAPVAGARVLVQVPTPSGAWGGVSEFADTAADGSFAIADAPSGSIRIGAYMSDSRTSEQRALDVAPGESVDGIVLVLPAYADPGAISGVVRDVDGRPLGGAPLQWSATGNGSTTSGTTQSAADGRFRLSSSDAQAYRVTAGHPRGEARSVSKSDVAPGTHGIELQLVAQMRIPLRVRDPNGAPVARFTYRVDEQVETMRTLGRPVEIGAEVEREAEIAVPGNPFSVAVVAPGFASQQTEVLSPTEPPPFVEVVLAPLPALRGRVVRGADPVRGARVRAHPALVHGEARQAGLFDLVVVPCSPCAETTTDADGRFSLAVDAEGTWSVRVAADGHPATLSQDVEVASGGTTREIVVDLAPRGAIAGVVRDRNGAPLARRTVAASCGDASPVTTISAADGRYELAPLAPGGWQVRVLDPQRNDVATTSMRRGDEAAREIDWDCRVVAGATTTHDVVEEKKK